MLVYEVARQLPAGSSSRLTALVPNIESGACLLGREVRSLVQNVVPTATPDTIDPQKNALARLSRLLFQSDIEITLHFVHERFDCFFE